MSVCVCVCVTRRQPEGRGHGGQPDDGHQPACGHSEERQAEELQPAGGHFSRNRPGGERRHQLAEGINPLSQPEAAATD